MVAYCSGRTSARSPTGVAGREHVRPFDPKSFPYGDGVYGLQRDAVLTFDEWGQCLLQRDELEYDSIFDDRVSATPSSPTGCVGGPLSGDFWADGASVQDCSEDCYQRVSAFVRRHFPNWSGGNEMDFDDVRLEILSAVEEHIDNEAELMAAENVMDQVLRRMVVAKELRSVHRDDCEMLSSAGATRSAGATPDSDPLPRWRSARDLQTVMYCLWRRRAYIRSGRLFAKKRKWHDALRDIGKVKAQEMYMTCEILGKGAGLKEALSNPEVPERVKRAMKHLLLCMSSVVGSNAHRTTLRHINSSYRLLFGPPLLFTTPNFADVCSPLLNLMYRGEPVGSWRVLEEHAPAMPSTEEMLRRVARDPVSQALFFDLMVELFLEHVLGVDMQQRHADGVASSGGLGLFGCVLAFFGPVETQGRGGLHPHMHVWVLNPIDANLLDKLRSGDCDAELIEKLQRWRDSVLEKVATLQFDIVEEFGRQLGFVGADQLPSVPFSERQQKNSRTAEEYGVCEDEEDDLPIKPAPASAPKVLSSEYGPERWAFDKPQGPRRMRPHVPQAPPELDPHQVGRDFRESRQAPLTGAHLSLQPDYRRKPPYRTLSDGSCRVWMREDVRAESRVWATRFARRCFVRSHIHKCMNTCYKHRGGGEDGDLVRVCRFNFHHEYHTVAHARRTPPRQCSRDSSCPLRRSDARLATEPERPVHPDHCPPPARAGEVHRFLRQGKALVLPKDGVADGSRDYTPHVNESEKYSAMGRVKVLRYNPNVSSSNPAGQVAVRCNWDVQCFDRVHVVTCRFKPVPVRGGGVYIDQEDDGGFMWQAAEEGYGDPERPATAEHWDEEDGPSAEAAQDRDDEWEEPGEVCSEEDVVDAVLLAVERMFRDAANSAHYSADYITKANPTVRDTIPEQAIGIERLNAQRADAEASLGSIAGGQADAIDREVEDGRLTLIRLETSSNRAALKKLSEMMFQFLCGHECYMSHLTWTVFCKVLVRLAYKASRRAQLRARVSARARRVAGRALLAGRRGRRGCRWRGGGGS